MRQGTGNIIRITWGAASNSLDLGVTQEANASTLWILCDGPLIKSSDPPQSEPTQGELSAGKTEESEKSSS